MLDKASKPRRRRTLAMTDRYLPDAETIVNDGGAALREMVRELRRANRVKDERIAKLEAALAPFAEKFLYPDDLGFEHSEDIRADEDWDEDDNDMVAEHASILRRDIRRAREILAKERSK